MQDDDLSVLWLAGREKSLVLAFGGVQQGQGMPKAEFARTASADGRNHVLFIGEPRPSWYSRAGVTRRIVEIVEKFLEQHDISDVRSIGNSMGGYGALYFTGLLPIRIACAFSPQVSMNAEAIDERRWRHFRKNFGPDLVWSVAESIRKGGATCLVTFGANDPGDARQAKLLPQAPNLNLFTLAGGSHNAVRLLKEHGLLADVVAAKLAGDVPRLRQIYGDFESLTTTSVGRLISQLKWRFPRSAARRHPDKA